MPTSYPGSIDSYSTKLDGVSDVLAADINNLQDAVVALQNRVGTTAGPTFVTLGTSQTISGAKTFSSVVGNSSGRYTTSGGGVGMYEMHLPGVVARAWYLAADGITRLATTNGGGSASATLLSIDGAGNFAASGNVTAYSDERLKTNWRDLQPDLLTKLAGVKVGVYDRKDTGETQIGVSAQSLQGVMPWAVRENTDGMLSVAYGNAALAGVVLLAREVLAIKQKLGV